MEYEYIRNHYKVPVEYGREIMFKGQRKGIIVKDQGNYIGVNFEDKKPTSIEICHPTYEIEYLGIAKPRNITTSQRRYQYFREHFADNYSFKEFIKYNLEKIYS